MLLGGAVIVASIVVAIATLHRWTQAGNGGESRTEHRGDDAGGGPRRHWPDPPQHGGGGSDPAWWPEFERQLALYVAARETQQRQPPVLPAEPAPHAIRPRRRPTASP
jgi:hypothetical protein